MGCLWRRYYRIMATFNVEPLNSPRLRLEAVSMNHADEAALTFADPALHEFIGGAPSTAAELAARYALLERGRCLDGTQLWFNWMLRERTSGRLVGTVQATVDGSRGVDARASLAWVVGAPFQRQGYAGEAARAVAAWLREGGVDTMQAFVHPHNEASAAIARSLGLKRTETVDDGEFLWTDFGVGAGGVA